MADYLENLNIVRCICDSYVFQEALTVYEETLRRRPDYYPPHSIYNMQGKLFPVAKITIQQSEVKPFNDSTCKFYRELDIYNIHAWLTCYGCLQNLCIGPLCVSVIENMWKEVSWLVWVGLLSYVNQIQTPSIRK